MSEPLDVPATRRALDAACGAIVYLCNAQQPTGDCLRCPADIELLRTLSARLDALVAAEQMVVEWDRWALAEYGVTYTEMRSRIAAVYRGDSVAHEVVLRKLRDHLAATVSPARVSPGTEP